jgi:hypothetical protein
MAEMDETREREVQPARTGWAMVGVVLNILGMTVLFDGLWGFGQNELLLAAFFSVASLIALILGWDRRRTDLAVSGAMMASVICSVILVEILLDCFFAKPLVPKDQDALRRYIAAPWRDPVSEIPAPGVFRIIGLSDSFGLAGGAKNYQYVLEDMLKKHGIPVEMVNLSGPGYQPTEQLEMLRQFAGALHPDLILHGFFVGNDFQLRIKAEFVDLLGLPLNRFRDSRHFRPQHFLLFQWLRGLAKVVSDQILNVWDRYRGLPPGTYSEREFLRIERQRMQVCRWDASEAMNWPRTLRSLRGIRSETAHLGARYAMVILPDQFQVEDSLMNRLLVDDPSGEEVMDLFLPQGTLVNECSKSGVPVLDLLPVFRNQGEMGGLYASRDTHLSDRGNQLAAEHILEFLLDEGLVPQSPEQEDSAAVNHRP